jgi:hypothetical protein
MAAQPESYSYVRLLWLGLTRPDRIRHALQTADQNQELQARLSTQDQLLRNFDAAARAAESRALSAETRADAYHQELVHSYKTHENWLASGLANRTIHADAPLPERPKPPSYRDAEGNPIELPGRGVPLRHRIRKDEAKVAEMIGKTRADFEKWAAANMENFYTPSDEPASDVIGALKHQMGDL